MTKREQFLLDNPGASPALALLEKREKANGKNGLDFTREEILVMYQEAERSFTVLRVYSTYLRSYALYETGSMRAFGDVTAADLRTCAKEKRMVVTREEANDIEAHLLNATDRAVMELAWEGVNGWREVTAIRPSSVTPNGTLKLVDGREIPMTARLHQYLMDAFGERTYTIYSDVPRTFDLLIMDGVYKAKYHARNPESDWAKKKWYAQIINTISEFANVHLYTETMFSAIDLRNFGLYDKFSEIAARNHCDIFKVVVDAEEGEAVLRQYGISTTYRARYALWRTLKENYEIQ